MKNFVHAESAPFFGHHGMQGNMEQEVSQLLFEVIHIPTVNRFDDFVRFFEEAVADGPVRLLTIPRALPS
jgi:hypothetical protein